MWNYFLPTDIHFGAGVLDQLPSVLQGRHVLLVADSFLVKSGLTARLQALCPRAIDAVFSDFSPNPSVEEAERCARAVLDHGCEFLLALGGGSAMDCAKSAAAAAAMGCSARALLEGRPITAALPVGAIPTTAGTGSELTAGAVLSDRTRGRKDAIFSPLLFPRFALIDPGLTLSCPPAVTASSGIDVLMHALDALSSRKSSPATDALALEAARLVLAHLRQAFRHGDDLQARTAMSTACTLAAQAFSQTGTTGCHASSYLLTERFGLPHGAACAFTAELWLLANAEARPRLHDHARALGFGHAEALARAISDLKRDLGLPLTLEDAGMTAADLPDLARSTVQAGNYGNNPAPLTEQEVLQLLQNLPTASQRPA